MTQRQIQELESICRIRSQQSQNRWTTSSECPRLSWRFFVSRWNGNEKPPGRSKLLLSISFSTYPFISNWINPTTNGEDELCCIFKSRFFHKRLLRPVEKNIAICTSNEAWNLLWRARDHQEKEGTKYFHFSGPNPVGCTLKWFVIAGVYVRARA